MRKDRRPILILLAGGSGSGKTTVAEEIIKNLPSDINGVSICQDRYYLDDNHDKKNDPINFNYDHPNAFDWKLMREHLKQLMNNQVTNLPIYDYKTHSRKSDIDIVEPRDVIIFEGIHALHDDEINSLAELKIFVDTPKD